MNIFLSLKRKASLLALIIFGSFFSSLAQLNVPINVNEPSGYGTSNFPVTAMVPLPYGQYQDVNNFKLIDNTGTEIEAQFNPIMRNVLKDNSLRYVQIIFMASLSPGEDRVYTLQEGAPGAINNPIAVVENANNVTVNTGEIEFRVLKTGFNLFDEVKLVSSGTMLVSSSTNQGTLFTDRNDLEKFFSNRTIDKFTIEENGPIRTVIRVEGYTNTTSANNQDAGFIIRLYAYKGSSHVKVDVGIINGERTQWGHPLYFNDISVVLPLNLTNPTVRMGSVNGVYTSTSAGGRKLVQWSTNNYKITKSDETLIEEGPNRQNGWMDVADNNGGVFTSFRNFWQSYPNGLEFDDQGRLRTRLWPKGQHLSRVGNSSGMYWIDKDMYWMDDMAGNRKELLYSFHDGSASNQDLKQLDKNFQWYPVASVPYSWHQQCGQLDFDGTLPNGVVNYMAGYPDTLYSSAESLDTSSNKFNYGWNIFGGDMNRAYYTAGTGGFPPSDNQFLISGSSYMYFTSEKRAMGDVNLRRSWCPGWTYDEFDQSSPMGVGQYASGTWRSEAWEYYLNNSPAYIPETAPVSYPMVNFAARDYPHLWSYAIEEYYNASGDPWVKDLMEFWVENFKSVGYNYLKYQSNGDPNGPELSMRIATRGIGHALNNYLMAQRITNSADHIDHVQVWLDRIIPLQNTLKYGHIKPTEMDNGVPKPGFGEAPFQVEFLARPLVSYMDMVEEHDIYYWQKALGVVYGFVEWNNYFANYGYYWNKYQNYGIEQLPYVSNFTGGQFLDVSTWMAMNFSTAEFRTSADKGWHPLSKIDPNNMFSITEWKGSWMARQMVKYYEEFYQNTTRDFVAPSKITALNMNSSVNGMTLSFPRPDDAVRYLVRWSENPIKEGPYDLVDDSTLWWAGEAGGVYWTDPDCENMEHLEMGIPVNQTIIYVTVKSLDANNNLSVISNNLVVDLGALTPLGPPPVCAPLSIELIEFSAKANWKDHVEVRWKTASENNNDYFVVERSSNNEEWEQVAIVDGAGNSSTQINYQVLDKSPLLGVSYYRLKQIDLNGSFNYYGPKVVSFEGIEIIDIFPNPAENEVNYTIISETETTVNMQVVDVTGRAIKKDQADLHSGENNLKIDMSSYAPGWYVIKVVASNGRSKTQKEFLKK